MCVRTLNAFQVNDVLHYSPSLFPPNWLYDFELVIPSLGLKTLNSKMWGLY